MCLCSFQCIILLLNESQFPNDTTQKKNNNNNSILLLVNGLNCLNVTSSTAYNFFTSFLFCLSCWVYSRLSSFHYGNFIYHRQHKKNERSIFHTCDIECTMLSTNKHTKVHIGKWANMTTYERYCCVIVVFVQWN